MSKPTLDGVSPVLVLVETMGPANLGSVARSAAAFGLNSFRLVTPKCQQDESTLMWACYGKRVLENIEVFDSLEEALADTKFAVGLSRREGKWRHRHTTLSQAVDEVIPSYELQGKVAFVFGNEESGLSRDHLAACQITAEIPVVADDGSLNLAHAVTVTLYEVLGRGQKRENTPNVHEQPATDDKLLHLMDRGQKLLELAGYPRHHSTVEKEMTKLKDIALRSQLEQWEVRLLLGVIKQLRHRLENPKESIT